MDRDADLLDKLAALAERGRDGNGRHDRIAAGLLPQPGSLMIKVGPAAEDPGAPCRKVDRGRLGGDRDGIAGQQIQE
jgi:hypothetical protein